MTRIDLPRIAFCFGLMVSIAVSVLRCEAISFAEGPSTGNAAVDQSSFVTGVLPDDDVIGKSQLARPEEILHEYGLTADRFQQIEDGDVLTKAPDELGILLRLLLRLPGLPLINIEQRVPPAKSLARLVGQPSEYRGEMFRVEGRVVAVETIQLAEADASRFTFNHFYRCHLLAGDPEVPAVVYVRSIPESWDVNATLDERVSFYGLFLKRGAGSVGVAPLVFASSRLAWHADTLLGDLGMDCGLFDSVEHNRGMLDSEAEVFYQLLASMDQAGTAELLRHARNDLIYQGERWIAQKKELLARQKKFAATIAKNNASSAGAKQELKLVRAELRLIDARIENLEKHSTHEFISLLEDPSPHVGKLRMYRGMAQRIARIRVPVEIAERFGFTHYYQIDVTVNLEHRIKMVKPTKDGNPDPTQVERVTWTHPATLCVRTLPKGMPTGEKIHENIRFAAFLFKNWGYPTSEITEDGNQWRSAPMLIGREPVWDVEPTSSLHVYSGAIAGALFVVALTGIWIGVWRLGRGDDKFHRNVVAKTYDVEDGVSLNDIGLVAESVDFSYLNENNSESGQDQSPDATPSNAANESATPEKT